ncbi:MAG: DUF2252 family protein [Actinomycetales bacterium]|nr:DUF2252 family protein [Actinomycetales bacterium]
MTSDPGALALPTEVRKQSAAERAARGRAARALVSRTSLGEWQPAADRFDPVRMLLEQEQSRIPALLPIRHARMAAGPFAFYRGAAILMAADLGSRPSTELVVQACGDAHLSNFGLFAAPDRSLIFDVNDFDETHPAPFEWDVARLITSFELAGQEAGLADAVRTRICRSVAAAYRGHMQRFAGMQDLDVWYERVDTTALQALARAQSDKQVSKVLARSIDKARTRDRWSAVSKLTTPAHDSRQFLDHPPLLTRIGLDNAARRVLDDMFRDYRSTLDDDRRELIRRYHIVDIGLKIVGVGSVGLLAFVILLQGRDADDAIVLQVKQAMPSVLEPYTSASDFAKQGHRVASGQRLMQAASDVFLGWVTGPAGRDYYVRQLRDMKWSPDVSRFDEGTLSGYAQACAWALARAHARTGDAVAMAAYLGESTRFEDAMARFAAAYARQSNADFDAFMRAVGAGTVAIAGEQEQAAIVERAFSPESLPHLLGARPGTRE